MSVNKSGRSGADYVKKCETIVCNGVSTITINLGIELGLFRALASFKGKPALAQQVADVASCKERYVREWLNACVAADLCQIDPEGNHYWLSEEECEAVTSRPFMEATVFGGFLRLFSAVNPQIASCFKKDGPEGSSYDEYPGFAQTMAKFTEYLVIDKIKTHVVPLLPEELQQRLEKGGMKILDVGCGAGGTTRKWAELYPKCELTGFDFGEEAIAFAKAQAAKENLHNVTFLTRDSAKMDAAWTSEFDMVMITDALHDMARPDLCLEEIQRVLKPEGFFLFHDINAHSNPAKNQANPMVSNMYVASYCHCIPVSLYFPGGTRYGTCWGQEKARNLLTEGGFKVLKQGSDGPPGLQYIHAVKNI